MIITCPACSAQYMLPDGSIGEKGRRVKCTTCAYTWLQSPETIEKPAFIIPEYTVVEDDKEQIAAPRKERFTPVVAAKSSWPKVIGVGFGVAAALVLVTLLFAAGMRENIVARAPASALLFEKIGVPVAAPAKGLVFSDVTAQFSKASETDMLNIKGKLGNKTKKDIKLPVMLIRLNGKDGVLKDWPVNLYGKVSQAGTTNEFTYDLKDFPPNGQSVTLLFAD